VYLLRELTGGELSESTREYRFIRDLRHRLPAAQAPQDHVHAQTVSQGPRMGKVENRFGHASASDVRPIMGPAAPSLPDAHKPVQLQHRQRSYELLVALTHYPQLFP
jgi:hypothetical protein